MMSCHFTLPCRSVNTLLLIDVFHWPCLDHYARQLPSNTAPAGYTCPTCNAGIFPHSNLVSPVADKLIERLSEVNWARTGLGLPLVKCDYLFSFGGGGGGLT